MFHLNTSAVEDESLMLKADMSHEEMRYLLDCIIWLYLFMPVSLFPREDYEVETPFHRD